MSTRYWIPLALSLLLAACAGDAAGGGDNPGADAGNGGGGCSFSLIPPSEVALGQQIEVQANYSGGAGFLDFFWTVRLDGVDLTLDADFGERILFTPTEPGPYEVSVTGTQGSVDCLGDSLFINVNATGAQQEGYWLRISGAGLPAQERRLSVFGGADQALGVVLAEEGTLHTPRVVDALGNGLGAYLRWTKVGDGSGLAYETFTDSQGQSVARLPDGIYDLLVVPSDGSRSSYRAPSLSGAALSATVTVPNPISIGGQVLTQAGQPLVGADVSLVVDGARSGRGTTDAQGRFDVEAYAGALTGVSVVPPSGSGLPQLVVSSLSGQSVDTNADLAIQFAVSPVSGTVDASLALGGDAALASVQLDATLASAGTVDAGTVEALPGRFRQQIQTAADGSVTTLVPAGPVDAFVHSADATESRVHIGHDFSTTSTLLSTLSPAVDVPVSVSASERAAVEGAQLLATPIGVMAGAAPAEDGVSDASGDVQLPLRLGGSYELVVRDQLGGDAAAVVQTLLVEGPSPVLIELPPTIELSGELQTLAGSAQVGGARVSLHCDGCTGTEVDRAIALGVVASDGSFTLRVPDPGTVAPAD